jgi:hypothetical protein
MPIEVTKTLYIFISYRESEGLQHDSLTNIWGGNDTTDT